MDWTWYLFSLEGRINRAKMWLAGLVIGCWTIFLVMLLLLPIGYLLGWPEKFHFSIDNIFAVFDPKSYRGLSRSDLSAIIVQAILLPLFLWICFATAVKRLHDRNKSSWWIVPLFVAPGFCAQFGDRLPDTTLVVFVAWIASAFYLWGIVELYFLKGTAETNRFGPDPLAEDEDTRLRRSGLGSRGPAWDQRREIELAPHRASPMSSMHVKRGHE
jgi:uncharacterized membrane protein YhaH (DUF805 family)